MGKLTIVIPDELEKQFRMKIVRRYGGRKGDLRKAVIEAIKTWLTVKTV